MTHFDLLFLLIALILLILLSGFFSVAETGMMSINRYRLRHKVREGHKTAQLVQALLERPDRLLGVVLIGNTFANILASALATVIAVKLFGDAGLLISTLVLTLVILIFAEVTPKTLAAIYPERTAFLVSYPLWLLLKILYPIVWLANAITNGLLAIFQVKVKRKLIAERLNKEELRTVVHESIGSIEQSVHEELHRDMLLSVLDLEKIKVNDVMLPRKDIVGIDLSQPWENILKILFTSSYTRLPIYYGHIEKVIGIFDLRDALRLMSKNHLTKQNMIKVAKEPYYVPEGTALNTQIQKFRDNKAQFALVVDEYGDILGLLTLEDIVEEIVGELDSSMAPARQFISEQKDGSYLVKGVVNVRELNKLIAWNLPEAGPKTLSGLIVERLESIPEGKVCLAVDDYRIEVLELNGSQIILAKAWLNKE